MTADRQDEGEALAALWSRFSGLIDADQHEAVRGVLAERLPFLHYVPGESCSARAFIDSLAILANNAPAAFEAMRGWVLEAVPLCPPGVAELLRAMLAHDDGTLHAPVIRRLVAGADLEVLRAVTGAVPARSLALLRSIDDQDFLLTLAQEGRGAACLTAAIALAAIDAQPAQALRRAAALLPDGGPGTEVKTLVKARLAREAGLAAPAIRPGRLKVALCVSGQLRGWRAALATWQPLFQDGHDVTIFVQSWRLLGRQAPRPAHLDLFFPRAFRAELARCLRLGGEDLLEVSYPSIPAWFRSDEEVSAEALCDAYRTRHVVLHDDRAPPFSSMAAPEKMYDKVERCFEQARSSGAAFDVLVRIRPDKSFDPSPDFDWREVLAQSQRAQAVLADDGPQMHVLGDLIIGDQFACGAPEVMTPYLRAASFTRSVMKDSRPGLPYGFYAHRNFAYACLCAGVRVLRTPGLHFGLLRHAPPIPPATLLALLRRDIAARGPVLFDAALLRVAAQDAAA